MQSNHFRRLSVIVGTVSAIGLSNCLLAADSTSGRGYLEEIIVTTQKREQDLQEVPLSVTAYSGEYLEKANVVNMVDLEDRVPNLIFDEFAPGQPRYTIRGIGSGDDFATGDAAVGVFIDEVYMARPETTVTSFYDLDRVEVLRGPQGTLFGRNVVGGAIAYHTRKPTETTTASAEATLGEHGQEELRAYLSGALGEKTFGKISLVNRNLDGYAKNFTTGKDVEDEEYFGARAALRFVPNEDLEIQLNVDGSSRRGSGRWWDLAIEGPFSQGNSNPDPREGNNHPEDGHGDIDNWGTSLKVDWQTDAGTLTSITAYRESDMDTRANTTGLLVGELGTPTQFAFHQTLFIQQDIQQAEQFSQEFRLTTNNDGPLNWVAGLFYLHENVQHTDITDFRFTFFGTEGRQRYDSDASTDAFAVFANATYDFSEQLSAQLGVRWSHDEKEQQVDASGVSFTGYTDNTAPSPGGWSADRVTEDWEAFTPSASIKFQATEDALIYATVSKGFKSGGFNDSDRERLSAEEPFDPEFAWNYEVGAKTEWLDRRLRLNMSLFYLDYEDLQVSLVLQPDPNLPPFGITGNAGEAEISGAELEWEFYISQNFNFYGNYSAISTEINDLALGGTDLSGNDLPTPDSRLFAGLAYTQELGDLGTATLRLEYTNTDEFFNTIQNTAIETIPSKEVYDASLTFDGAQGHWSVKLWGKNLTDELNINSITEVPPSEGYASYDPPRSYGITVRYDY